MGVNSLFGIAQNYTFTVVKSENMAFLKNTVLPVLLAAAWISFSEFFRNQFLLTNDWQAHYAALGLQFPSAPVNGAVWGIWSLCFAIGIQQIAQKFGLVKTALIAWWMGFVLMWLVTGNLNVLPFGILIYAVPLSLLEAFIATWILFKFK